MRLEGKIAAVTGGGSGMGKAISEAYAREGARVIVADLNLDAARGVAEQISAAGGEAMPMQTDVRDQAQANGRQIRVQPDFEPVPPIAGDAAAMDRDVAGLDLTGKDVDDASVAEDQVGGRVSARDGEEVGRGHRCGIVTHLKRTATERGHAARTLASQSRGGGCPPPSSFWIFVSPLSVLILPLICEVFSM